jgi:flavin reductase (DIM6/NTAB) family NADH-FMN oxidoreductase RutF
MEDSHMDKKAFRDLSYGVYIVSTWDSGRMTGCTANSAMQITSSPATIALSLNHDNHTNACVRDCGHFALSILSEASDPSLIGRFGFFSGRDTDKFDGVDHYLLGNVPVVRGACAHIVCRVIDAMETATHTVFLGEVIEADKTAGAAPMTYAYYHNVIKGTTPKNAPTFAG